VLALHAPATFRLTGNSVKMGGMDDQRLLSRLHYELIHGLMESGACPANSALASRMGITPVELEEFLRALSAIHGVVLHPHACKPWIIHPFSLTPTIHWIEGKWASWWAPCVWCALGVATLVGGEVRIHTRYGAESETVTILVKDGQPVGCEGVYVHFAIPPAQAWNNVHEHCSMVLPFRSADEIQEWCNRHGLPLGQPVPLHQVAELARMWYGSHANLDWHKWTMGEAQDIFHQAGLRSDFWDIATTTDRF
jgi:Alkylmercury lyase